MHVHQISGPLLANIKLQQHDVALADRASRCHSLLSHLQRLEQLLARLLAGDLGLVQLTVALDSLPMAADVLPRPHLEPRLDVHFQDARGHVLPPAVRASAVGGCEGGRGGEHTSLQTLVRLN